MGIGAELRIQLFVEPESRFPRQLARVFAVSSASLSRVVGG
jgi:hypothetical protein